MLLNIFKVLCTTLLTDTVLIPSMYHYRMCLPVDYSEALTQKHDCHPATTHPPLAYTISITITQTRFFRSTSQPTLG